jgi:hypothetical protein
MTVHIGMLTLKPTATIADRESIRDGLVALVGVVPGLEKADVQLDLGLKDGNASLVFAMTFDSEESWRGYGAHPAHVAVIHDRIGPVLESKAFVQVDGLSA